jgi:enoyl-[acyl-carrier protein] reductase I
MSTKTYLITGVAMEESIGWAAAERLLREGATCYVAALPTNVKRARRLMRAFSQEDHVIPLDVRSEASLTELGALLVARNRLLDGVLHSIAYAPADDLAGPVTDVTRTGFLETMEVSVYSLCALVRAATPVLQAGSSIVALTYYGSQKAMHGYGVLGAAKAALESLVRYLASELGPRGIRVNSVSPGPILTPAASAFGDIQSKIEEAALRAPLRQRTTQAQVAEVVRLLFSPEFGAVTGQCVHVDHGLSIVGS